MAKDKNSIEWFGADTEQRREKKHASMLDGFKGVDSEIPTTVEQVDEKTGERRLVRTTKRMPAPRGDKMHVVTSGGKSISDRLVQLKNRYKLMNSAFLFSNNDDKELWEKRRDIAFHEMQAQAFREQLDHYMANPMRKGDPKPRPEQVTLLKTKIAQHRGMVLELTGQGD
jgi:hypothetical protein